MPIVNGHSIPNFYRSIVRQKNSARVRLVVQTSPNDIDPRRYTYTNADIEIGQAMRTRRMVVKSDVKVFFEFTFPPTQISYEGFGTEITEIPRPLQKPLIDVRGGKNYKAVFEFLVAEQFDGVVKSVEEQLAILEWMVNYGEPVYFENFDYFLTKGFWYLAEFNVKSSRVNTDGAIVAAQCSIGLLEYQDFETKFAKFPKIKYTNSASRKTGAGGGGSGSDGTTSSDGILQGATGIPTTINSSIGRSSEYGRISTVAPATKLFKWSRNKEPSALEKKHGAWEKIGGEWVLYTKTLYLPYSLYDLGVTDNVQAEAVLYKNLTLVAKYAYLRQIEKQKTLPKYKK